MSKLKLTLACWNYDRTRALADGSVQPDGIELTYLNLPVEETFFRMLRYREFDVAEMSLSSYTVSLFQDDPPFIAIPVFPSRVFRHGSIFVSTKSGVHEPKDLIGKRVGNPEYQLTALVWIRGILSDEYGISPAAVEYWTGVRNSQAAKRRLRSTCRRCSKYIASEQTKRSRRCSLMENSMHSTAHGSHRRLYRGRRMSDGCLRIMLRSKRLTTQRPVSFRLCTRWSFDVTSTTAILG